MSTARDTILASIRKSRQEVPAPPPYAFAKLAGDAPANFIAKAQASIADVREIASIEDAPQAVLAILAELNVGRTVHIPPTSELLSLPWDRAMGLNVTHTPPTGVDTAFSSANYAIAETGTLAFFSGPARLRPGITGRGARSSSYIEPRFYRASKTSSPDFARPAESPRRSTSSPGRRAPPTSSKPSNWVLMVPARYMSSSAVKPKPVIS